MASGGERGTRAGLWNTLPSPHAMAARGTAYCRAFSHTVSSATAWTPKPAMRVTAATPMAVRMRLP